MSVKNKHIWKTMPPAIWLSLLVATGGIVAARGAMAHGGEALDAAHILSTWNITFEISGLLAFVLIIYLRGARRRNSTSRKTRPLRHVLFMGGILAFFISLQSPLDPMGERLFWAHQLQHFLLRMVGPMLVVLARPQGILISGLPRVLRRQVLGRILGNSFLSGLFGFLMRPWPAFILFVASLYIWQIPSIHTVALLNPALHYTMHITMLLAGLLFFAMIFDHRDSPIGAPFGTRVFLLFATIVSNILIGSVTTLKEVVLYDVYDIQGRLFDMPGLFDESAGGFILWVPSSMMILIGILITMFGWNRIEEQRFARRYEWTGSNTAALEFPETAAELRLKVRDPNRRMGLALAFGAFAMFAIVMTTVITISS